MFVDNIETYWGIASHTIAILGYIVEGWIFYKFVKPFMKEKQHYVGIIYSITMLVFYLVPQQITYPNLQGAFAACITMCLMDTIMFCGPCAIPASAFLPAVISCE